MRSRARRGLGLAVAIFGIAAAPKGAMAQFGMGASAGASGASGGTPGLYANPYMNPMTNPFMNPYMAAFAPANPQNAAMYFFAAQASMGGIGSGQLSGSRPAPGAGGMSGRGPGRGGANPAGGPNQAVGASQAMARASNTPGGSASHYFNRGYQPQSGPGADRYYNRANRYYSPTPR